MLIYAGIDEAGYGPLLGPLCVACSVVAIDDLDPASPELKAPNLWDRLKAAVCDSPSDKRNRIAIADSKRLKGARDAKAHPLRHLERGVLSAIAQLTPASIATDADLFGLLGSEVPDPTVAPWYDSTTALPLALDSDSLAISANRLRVAAERGQVRFLHLACQALDGATFNERASRAQKSELNWELAMRHVDRLWSAHGQQHPRVVVDRHGGRMHYREPLQLSFPEAKLTIVAETDLVSRYRLEDPRGALTISFEVESEERHLPNALASMTAKFTRELFMERMNRFFTGHNAELKPTAGYVEDGRRYLKDIRPTLAAIGASERAIVRVR